jgi:signal transduction histidine kinase
MLRRVREADQERLRLHARAADASTDERRRIAGSLHDGVVQDLSAAPLFMSQAVEQLRRRPATDTAGDHAAADGLLTAATAVRNSVASLRSLLIELYPPHLAQAGLPAALTDLAARVQARGVATELQVPDILHLPPELDALLFRVAQEALLNAVKHAPGSTVVLTVTQAPGVVTMVIRDDGAGFDPTATAGAPGTGHFGMWVLTDLAQAAGAALDLATAPGQGTALRLQVPVPS